MTKEQLRLELENAVTLPGLTNIWVPPIRSRIDMTSTGIRTPVGIKVSGPDPDVLEHVAADIERIVRVLPGVRSAYAERLGRGRYIDVDIDRTAAARVGLNAADVHEIVRYIIGGSPIATNIEGRERYSISLRIERDWRDGVARIQSLPLVTPTGAHVTLADVARIRVVEGPSALRSEDAMPTAWILVNTDTSDLTQLANRVRNSISTANVVPSRYSVRVSGAYEHYARAMQRLTLVVPATLVLIVALLFVTLRRWHDVAIALASIPLALLGGVWLLWFLDFRLSVAVALGFIALVGVAVETAVVMLLFIRHAWTERLSKPMAPTYSDLQEAIVEGALIRLRPKLMTMFAIIASLLPLLFGTGTGSEVMSRIAAPMVGGMISTAALILVVVPATFLLVHRQALRR